VLRLDTKRFAADLMLTTGNHELEESMPFSAIQPVKSGDTQVHKQTPKLAQTKSEAAIM
jgi:hypothetical protein